MTAIWLMFSEGSTDGRRLGYFGAIFVDVDQRADGTTRLGVGLDDALPLLVTAVVITGFVLLVFVFYDLLVARKQHLDADAG